MNVTRLCYVSVVAAFASAVWGCSASQPVSPLLAPSAGVLPARHHITISEFSDLPVYSSYYGPSGVTSGPNNALWVTDIIDQDFGENAVVEIAESGKTLNTFYYTGQTSEGSDLVDLVEGPDGNLWITDQYNQQILRMTPSGSFTAYHLTTAPWSITRGPDNALWFTEGSAIGRITTKGAVSQYPVSGSPQSITTGPDKALWFTEAQGAIGRMTTHGKVKYFSAGISSESFPYWIAPGPDGALWFTEFKAGRIGRITTSGHVTEYSNGISTGEKPVGIAAGPDGAMWFTESECRTSLCNYNAKIGRITMSGSITEYDKFNTNSGPTAITEGPDKQKMWFTEYDADEMGRVNL